MASNQDAIALKVMVIGDGSVGKTCLLISYTTNKFPSEYVPTVFDNYAHDQTGEDGKAYTVGLWDTAGGEDYYRLRPLSYPQTDVFLICFDISQRWSFDNVEEYWISEINQLMPEIPRLIVGCKADLRQTYTEDQLVSYSEGCQLAEKVGAGYVETSALENKGLKECFQKAIKMATAGLRPPYTKRTKDLPYGKNHTFVARPLMYQKPRGPSVLVEPSTFMDDWLNTFRSSLHTDVTFLLDSAKHRLEAHAVILCSTSTVFNLLLGEKPEPLPTVIKEVAETPGGDGRQHIQITVADNITLQIFTHVLNFIYTGNPSFPDDLPPSDLQHVLDLGLQLDLEGLVTYCQNVQNGSDPELNQSLVSYQAERIARGLQSNFLNQKKLADVVFKCNDEQIYAHKCVLATRSEVMAAMFGGEFREGSDPMTEIPLVDISPAPFLSLLEYLYTDHAPLEGGDSVAVLVLADRYCQSRLSSLQQLYITKEVDRAGPGPQAVQLIDVARLYNALQLEAWLFHYMSTNYPEFEALSAYRALSDADRTRVEDHRWPNEWMLREYERYHQEVAKVQARVKVTKKVKKCVVM